MQSGANEAVCAECLAKVARPVKALDGASLCAECAEAYYVACAGCGGLIPGDDSLSREEKSYCVACHARGVLPPGVAPPSDEEIEELVSEYIQLHAEHKKLSERIDFLKERLKVAASIRQRVEGAVLLRSSKGELRCRYTSKINCIDDKVPQLEAILGPRLFESLFMREVKFKAVKDRINEFLSLNDAASEPLKSAVRDAIEEVETPSLIVQRQKK